MPSFHNLRGRLPFATKELHDVYGDIVRTGPNQLSYICGEAWDDIYGHGRGKKTTSFQKDTKHRPASRSGAANIILANDADHRRIRKLQSHAFSEKALAAQEYLLQDHIRELTTKLIEQTKSPNKGIIAINNWWNFFTFDMIGTLAVGESFHCVERGELHPWVQTLFDSIKPATWMMEASQYPFIAGLLLWMIPRDLVKKRLDHIRYSTEQTTKRLAMQTDRPDFITYMLQNNDDETKGMSVAELKENSGTLIIAGSETTASLLSGTVYHLLKNPKALAKLNKEIRGTFQAQTDITLQRLAEQKYLLACLEEGLRIYPPVPAVLPRLVPVGGAIVCGRFVPEGTSLGVPQWAASHSARNFRDPETFHPERWLDHPDYAADKRNARQPFSYGPRNCIGRTLAYAEMRLLLANLVWHFDLELMKESEDWLDRNTIYTLWMRPELMVKLTPRISGWEALWAPGSCEKVVPSTCSF
ncbi:hypothetical protein MMC30_006440 [Trapelia coarctata]|nr:hypothetical protein [Trapelia coarctata]